MSKTHNSVVWIQCHEIQSPHFGIEPRYHLTNGDIQPAEVPFLILSTITHHNYWYFGRNVYCILCSTAQRHKKLTTLHSFNGILWWPQDICLQTSLTAVNGHQVKTSWRFPKRFSHTVLCC